MSCHVMSCRTCSFLSVVVFLMKYRYIFFEVGHTHCNQDQIFSRSSVHLVDKDFFTFSQLCFHLKNSCSLIKYTEHIEFLTNWRDNVHDHLNGPTILSGITRHRLFALNAWRMVKYFSTAKEMHMIQKALGMTSTVFERNPSLSQLITNSWV